MNEEFVVDFKRGGIMVAAFRNTFLISIPRFIFYQNPKPKSGLKFPRPLSNIYQVHAQTTSNQECLRNAEST